MSDEDDERWLRPWLQRGFSPAMARRYRARLRAKRSRLKRGAHALHAGASNRRNRQRFANNTVQRERRRILGTSPVFWTADVVRLHPVRERILDGLYPQRTRRWRPIFDRRPNSRTIDLTNFSFVDEPVSTIQALQTIAEMECDCTDARLNFVDPLCLDIGSFLVLQSMYRGMLPIFSGGRISGSIKRVIDMVGLRHALNMEFKVDESRRSIWPLPFRTRSPQGTEARRFLRDQTSEVVTTEVLDYLNDVLGRIAKVDLNLEGERLAGSMVGEAINNAERHSEPETGDGTWSVAGFVARRKDGDEFLYRIHLALLSTGATIAESMLTAGDATKGLMEEYVRRHRTFFTTRLTVENLQTVFALQDGVSRIHDALLHGRGGTGLMDILEFFAELSGTTAPDRMRPRLAIVSGATCISLRPPHVRGTRKDGAAPPPGHLHAPRELWFNSGNTPDEPPDDAHVVSLPARLNGTLVAMAWTFDPEYLKAKAHGTG